MKDNGERFWSRIEVEGDCWIWVGTVDRWGYGTLGGPGAHRLVYEYLVGPAGEQLDHLCRRKTCVNPDHLEPVSQSTNILRREGSTENRCKYGHVGQIHRLPSGNRQCRVCDAARHAAWKAKGRVEGTGWTHLWRVRTRLPERFGQPCRVLVRGRLNSVLVEFDDGHRVVTSRNYVKLAHGSGGGE